MSGWIELRSEIVKMFDRLVVFMPEPGSTRFITPEPSSSSVERVRTWRIHNRERRNKTARAKNATERAKRAAYAREWRKKKHDSAQSNSIAPIRGIDD